MHCTGDHRSMGWLPLRSQTMAGRLTTQQTKGHCQARKLQSGSITEPFDDWLAIGVDRCVAVGDPTPWPSLIAGPSRVVAASPTCSHSRVHLTRAARAHLGSFGEREQMRPHRMFVDLFGVYLAACKRSASPLRLRCVMPTRLQVGEVDRCPMTVRGMSLSPPVNLVRIEQRGDEPCHYACDPVDSPLYEIVTPTAWTSALSFRAECGPAGDL